MLKALELFQLKSEVILLFTQTNARKTFLNFSQIFHSQKDIFSTMIKSTKKDTGVSFFHFICKSIIYWRLHLD
jgi:hypothetical protein